MRHLVISVDYEVFGNGSGDVLRHIVAPARRMAELCNANGVPLTIFFEVEEYLAFQKWAAELKTDLGYDPARLMREHVSALVQEGHDVQLHLHPEWYGATLEDGSWKLGKSR